MVSLNIYVLLINQQVGAHEEDQILREQIQKIFPHLSVILWFANWFIYTHLQRDTMRVLKTWDLIEIQKSSRKLATGKSKANENEGNANVCNGYACRTQIAHLNITGTQPHIGLSCLPCLWGPLPLPWMAGGIPSRVFFGILEKFPGLPPSSQEDRADVSSF